MIRTLTLLTALIALYGAPATAQMACGERTGVVAKLDSKYGETQRGRGLAGPGAIVELWASCQSGTWTILQTAPTGITCVLFSGFFWTDVDCEKGRPT